MESTASKRIKEIAADIGFGLTAIAPAQPDSRDVGFWKNWLEEGRHGEMKYLENPKKASILEWWAEAKSVVMVGLFYTPSGPGTWGISYASAERLATETPQIPDQAPLGRIASYACYPEYQKRMNKTLKEMLRRIQKEIPGTEGRMFSDTSPVLERMYARLSGLGWIGKNTMLIHPKNGSYFFLGGLALNLELEADTPELDHCGSCTRCIQTCPTEALTPYQMNASRCIAYLTIEKRSMESDVELETKTGQWIFGCDICQDVCPFNRHSHSSLAPEGRGQGEGWAPIIPNTIKLETIQNWSEEEFKSYFKGTPVLRAKWPGMRRNTEIALRNSANTFKRGESVG